MVKIEFENIVFNDKTQTYQVLNNDTCIYESNNEYEAIIFEAKRLLYGEKYNSRPYRRNLQKRAFVNGRLLYWLYQTNWQRELPSCRT